LQLKFGDSDIAESSTGGGFRPSRPSGHHLATRLSRVVW
jgi:hypothetical protein